MTDFTGPEIEALLWAAELAIDDQAHLLHYGNPVMDYGEEWPETASVKAENFRHIADAVQKFGATAVADTCLALAKEFEDVEIAREPMAMLESAIHHLADEYEYFPYNEDQARAADILWHCRRCGAIRFK